MTTTQTIEETVKLLRMLTTLDPESLARTAEFGTDVGFQEAVEPARRLVNLYTRIPENMLIELTEHQVTAIRNQATADVQAISDIKTYKAAEGLPKRNDLINSIKSRAEEAWNNLFIYTLMAGQRALDPIQTQRALESLASTIRSDSEKLRTEQEQVLSDSKRLREEQEKLLTELRQSVAEKGVSQSATGFSDTSNAHEGSAKIWLGWTLLGAISLVAWILWGAPYFISLDLFTAKGVPEPLATYHAISSKALVFLVFAYLTVLAGRNFMANKHNAVVNRQRQNALQTYTTMVTAATPEHQGIILEKAASAIFSPQQTGFAKGGSDSIESRSALDAIERTHS